MEKEALSVISRPRLLAQLGKAGRPNARITVLRAPLGYGKSLLLQQWAGTRSESALTIFIDAQNQPTTTQLWQRVLKIAEEIRYFECAVRPGDGAAAFRTWIQSVAADVVLIVDAVEPDAELEETLLSMVGALPNLSVVVAGRSFAFLDGPVAAVRAQTSVLTAEDLRFDAAEREQLVAARKVAEKKYCAHCG